ncbi:response regulator [Cohnella sp.]|uniref:response regulator transcription factor n=1 Tax=Cohnella sp. TaxID=1883426 RepID=UPI0035617AF9
MKKAILVDDEVFARKGLIRLIPWEKLGYEVVGEAENGEDACALIEEVRPDVVVTDIRMPVLDGLELIRKVQESGNDKTNFIIVSGYGDFKYAQQAVRYGVADYLLKPVDENELAATLERIAAAPKVEPARTEVECRLIQGLAFDRLLTGQSDEAYLGEASRILDLPLERPLRCVSVEINDIAFDSNEARGMEQMERVKQAIREEAAAHSNGKAPCLLARSLTEVHFLLFDKLGVQEIRILGERLIRAVGAHVDGVPRVYAGAIVPSLERVRESYASASALASFKFALDRSVLVHEEAAGECVAYKELAPALLTELLERLEERDEEGMEKATGLIFDMFREQRYSPESVHASISRCVHGVCAVIQNMQGDASAVTSLHRLLRTQLEPRTLYGLKVLFLEFLRESAGYMSGLRSAMTKGDIGKIKAYIDSQFGENLNLKSISKRFYLNPVYLGQLFKKTYGVYFNEYLLQIRIAEAKRQLRRTDRKVYEIAASVGFGNADYFVCQFERVEGRTPTEYKNAILSKA